MGKINLRSEHFRTQFLASGKTPSERLLGLSKLLSNWNKGTTLEKTQPKLGADLSIQDVVLLKAWIYSETGKAKVENPEIVADQILFLLIGAMRLQTQNDSEQPWVLVDQSIKNFLQAKRKNNTALLVTSIVITAGLGGMIMTTNNKADLATLSSESSINVVVPVALSTLANVYSKIKDGDCQLPQAAMLPPEQRQVYISFINDGNVDLENVENLKLALGLVNCLYPQKLMQKPN